MPRLWISSFQMQWSDSYLQFNKMEAVGARFPFMFIRGIGNITTSRSRCFGLFSRHHVMSNHAKRSGVFISAARQRLHPNPTVYPCLTLPPPRGPFCSTFSSLQFSPFAQTHFTTSCLTSEVREREWESKSVFSFYCDEDAGYWSHYIGNCSQDLK